MTVLSSATSANSENPTQVRNPLYLQRIVPIDWSTAPYLEGMKRVGVSGDQCVAFEDSPSGIRSAVGECTDLFLDLGLKCTAAGVKVIVGIMSTQTEETLKKAGATYIGEISWKFPYDGFICTRHLIVKR